MSELKKLLITETKYRDIDGLMRINSLSMPENYTAENWIYLVDHGICFTARINIKSIVGYIVGQPRRLKNIEDNKNDDKEEKKNTFDCIHLVSVAVFEKMRGQGIGTKLLKEFIEECKKQYPNFPIVLQVRKSASKNIDFYKRFGFVHYKEIKEYYLEPLEDCLIMKM